MPSPIASASAAAIAMRRGPTMSGRRPPSSLIATTAAANAVNTPAGWLTPRALRSMTMKLASAAYPTWDSESAMPGRIRCLMTSHNVPHSPWIRASM